MSEDQYTPEVLAIVCPICKALGMCLRPKRDGSDYMAEPHPERVRMAAEAAESKSRFAKLTGGN